MTCIILKYYFNLFNVYLGKLKKKVLTKDVKSGILLISIN